MAGDWIKMRVWISHDPRVIRMADYLAEQRPFISWLTDPVRQSCKESAYEHVTRNVITALCVTGLLVTWGTAREQGDRNDDDLVLNHCDKYTIDAITGIECFGEAMEFVGWLEDHGNGCVTFPKFFKDNESPDEKHKRQNAERQSRFRSKNNVSSNENSNVTDNVTVTHREEKRREDINTYTPEFESFWSAYPKRNTSSNKSQALKAWSARLKEGATPEQMILGATNYAIECERNGSTGTQYVKQPSTFLGVNKFYMDFQEVQITKPKWVPGQSRDVRDYT